MSVRDLYWLPESPNWAVALKSINNKTAWAELRTLASARLDFLRTGMLDKTLQRHLGGEGLPYGLDTKPVRLAILSSSTADHLLAGLRVGAMRRGVFLTTYVGDYGQYLQELSDGGSRLYAFGPTAILFAFDAVSLVGASDATRDAKTAALAIDGAIDRLRHVWRLAAQACSGQIIQQTVLPTAPALLGSNEHRLPGSQHAMIERLNIRMRDAAEAEGVDILALDERIVQDGIDAWHSPVLWYRARQEISPAATPLYGDLVARLLAAQQGRSSKCLVLDLDNTLWGGVIGDDGLEGIVLGQGGSLGEAFVAFQNYARELSRRGVILAVCSKNDEANALAPFDKHPDMLLKRSDIACFVANWQDKPANLRAIAKALNIGIDSLVLADDNPFERNLVRRELPMVAVPELPEDPALYARCIADAGYFEALRITKEDIERSQQYQGNIQRELLRSSATDVESYLKSLDMRLIWRPFDQVGLQRIVQLINKTNQFNLTTRRYTQPEVVALMNDPTCFTLQLRLVDSFGDNGIIAIVIGKPTGPGNSEMLIDTWLMSCRVLGRQVEEATLNVAMAQAARLGTRNMIGEYGPTAKNDMVREHYGKLGFTIVATTEPDRTTRWTRSVTDFVPYPTFIDIQQG
jgi:FkbH-like protein